MNETEYKKFPVGLLRHVVGDPLPAVGDPLPVVGDTLRLVGDPLDDVGDILLCCPKNAILAE